MKNVELSKGEKRRNAIMNVLKRQGKITIQEMIEKFAVSEATARRDLDELKEAGIIRSLGGAQLEGFLDSREVPFQEKKDVLWLEKEAIAAKAASLVEEGDIIGLSGGTTTFLIARALKQHKRITVVTNAVNIAMELSEGTDVQVVLTGGVMRRNSYELCGPLAEKSVEGLNIGKMFLGVDGFTLQHGITTFSELEADIAKMLIQRSLQTYAVFDHTKAGKASLFGIAPLDCLHACITNQKLDDEFVAHLKQRQIELYIADSNVMD
ncbi:DeoR/GlpR transcriptional regulator [Paenibacillus psychroresistens]|uniref:DeoR/GlpR transcriptional regulator n=1 Tax=Paenibacillus psychroresistens TaxID=1778678 RepID=A0A6B8RMS1_9BACL|nr:DeoR/GlpR family DNA-binding transcription regulator [Paenibacillus psychroresistens]QGQ97137.1 DeoR/GlpR transcriptional regulator [Paenibacillus psychroresistens]